MMKVSHNMVWWLVATCLCTFDSRIVFAGSVRFEPFPSTGQRARFRPEYIIPLSRKMQKVMENPRGGRDVKRRCASLTRSFRSFCARIRSALIAPLPPVMFFVFLVYTEKPSFVVPVEAGPTKRPNTLDRLFSGALSSEARTSRKYFLRPWRPNSVS